MTNQNEEEKFVAEALRIIDLTCEDVANLVQQAGKKVINENGMIPHSSLAYALFYNLTSVITFLNFNLIKGKTNKSDAECSKIACESTTIFLQNASNDALDDFIKDLNVWFLRRCSKK